MEYDILSKVIVVGDSQVGKTSLLLRYTDNSFEHDSMSTIGVDLRIKSQVLDGKMVKTQIWDTAGQERFRTITQTFYRGAHGVIIVFDLTNENSFDNVKMWHTEVKRNVSSGCIILLGNKCDQTERRVVSAQKAEILALELGMEYIETSAKKSENVEFAFQKILRVLIEKRVCIGCVNREEIKYPTPSIASEKPGRQCPIWLW